MTITIAELQLIDLFEGVVDDATLERWADAAEERWFEPGEVVMATGERRVAFKLLVEGRLDGYVLVDGREEHDHVHEPDVARRHCGAHRVAGAGDDPGGASQPDRADRAETFRRLLSRHQPRSTA